MKNQNSLLTRKQAATMLNLSVQTLAKWAMTGRHLPIVKIGRTVRYEIADIEKLIENSSTTRK
jgi:excisionase family DNA binding protein